MDNDELIRLARQLDVSLTNRKVKRDWLIEAIQGELEEHYYDGIPWKKIQLNDPAIQISGLTKKFGKTVAVRNLILLYARVKSWVLLGLTVLGRQPRCEYLQALSDQQKALYW